MDLAPSFQLYRVHTPVLITAIDSPSILQEWELYSSLYKQKKPVDLIFIPDGQHILQKPLDRIASQQENVDWFRFWLQKHERAEPDDPGQYVRWRLLRDMEDSSLEGSDHTSAGKINVVE